MKLFGTDGIRGKFNETPINHDELVKIGYAFAKSIFGDKSGKILISNDGRDSSSVIEAALSKGIHHQGSAPFHIGLYPTPALSIYLNSTYPASGLCAGIQITASHNPYYDNGVKFFDNHGHKINTDLEKNIESNYFVFNEKIDLEKNKISNTDDPDFFNTSYINFIDNYFLLKMKNINPPSRKLNILVDCANGATSKVISKILKNDFINIIPIHNEPTGKNINENCGATMTRKLKDFIFNFNDIKAKSSDYDKTREAKELKIDLGVAFDGDGDRAIFISPLGQEVNGDDILYILAKFHKKYNNLESVVGTQMTNYGIQDLYKKNDIKFIETEVGDKNVLKEMLCSRSMFGGESSGHILGLLDNGLYIGDGIITLIYLLEVLFKQERTIDQLKDEIISIPSKLFNTKVINKKKFLEDELNIKIFSDLEKMIGTNGRMLLRPSGTENLIRLLIEHHDAHQIEILSEYFYDNINKNTIV
tara:strand:+ start:1626 stop:3053 length:1428 start_codon:yes stop_codon:yes gene_type:complete